MLYQKNIKFQAKSWPKIEWYFKFSLVPPGVTPNNRVLYQKTLTQWLGHAQKSNAISKKKLSFRVSHGQKSNAISKNIKFQAKSWPKIECYIKKH